MTRSHVPMLVAACGVALLSVAPAFAQSSTSVPLTAFTRPSWMASGTQSLVGGLLQVRQNSAGWGWDLLLGSDSGNNADVFNAFKLAAVSGGTFTFVSQFDPALNTLSGTAQPGFLSINGFQQGFGAGTGDKWIQFFNKPTLGSAAFPLTGVVTSTTSLPIVGWTNGVDPTPADGTSNFYVEKNSTYFQFGFGTNSSNLSATGFNIVSATITAVPEPSVSVGLVCGAMGAVASLRRRTAGR